MRTQSVTHPEYLSKELVIFGPPETQGNPGYIEGLSDWDIRMFRHSFQLGDMFPDSAYIFHGTTLENARAIRYAQKFIPAKRPGMVGCEGMYLGCRKVAEGFAAISAAENRSEEPNRKFYKSDATTPALVVFRKDQVDEHFSGVFKADSVADFNPPFESYHANGAVDLWEKFEDLSEEEFLKKSFELSGCLLVPSSDPIDLSGLHLIVME